MSWELNRRRMSGELEMKSTLDMSVPMDHQGTMVMQNQLGVSGKNLEERSGVVPKVGNLPPSRLVTACW